MVIFNILQIVQVSKYLFLILFIFNKRYINMCNINNIYNNYIYIFFSDNG